MPPREQDVSLRKIHEREPSSSSVYRLVLVGSTDLRENGRWISFDIPTGTAPHATQLFVLTVSECNAATCEVIWA